MPAKTIGCKLLGGLGGQLWQIASTAGLAEWHGYRQVIPTGWPWRAHFQIPDEMFSDEPYDLDAVEVADLRSPLRPYLIDLNLILRAEQQVRHWYWPTVDGAEISEGTLAVHVRRGDYLDKPQWHPFVGLDYLKAAMAEAVDHPRITFSDDPQWCLENLGGLISYGSDWSDLMLMSLCSRHVISNSSFSWWAAWLARSDFVICPRTWYGPAWGLIDTSRFIPADWKQL